jgi:OOP family OmpA-OmpF porin
MPNVCSKCGSALGHGDVFCAKCGAPAAPQNVRSNAPAVGGTAGRAASLPKTIIIVGGIIALLFVVLVGGIWYAVHKGREKVAQLEARHGLQQTPSNPSAGRSGSPGNDQSSTDFEKNLSQLESAANGTAQNAQNPNAGASSSSNSSGGTNSGAGGSSSKPAAPYGWTLVNGKLVPAPAPTVAPPPKPVPMVPVAATGDQAHDWALEYERTVGGPEADLVVRTGDINNLSFGWKYYDFAAQKEELLDPFSGKSTQPHQWPDIHNIPANAPAGTDRIMIGSAVTPGLGDGYSGAIGDCALAEKYANNPQSSAELKAKCKDERALTWPTPIALLVGELPSKINAVVVQIFVDDFQPVPLHSHFQVSLNGTRIPNFEYAINALDQSGPIGKLLTLRLLPEYWPLLKSGTVKLLIDDPTTHVPDGYAIDFVRILVNPRNFKYQVSLAAKVTDADKHTLIAGANVTAALESATTDRLGKCELKDIPAGLVVATASAPGYDENSVTVDLPSGKTGEADIQLHRHEETTAALEKSIAQTGTATIYGIHFDTGSAKLRPDSLPALQAVLGLINSKPGSHWIIAGHTDNQGSDELNIPLSQSRAASVISWLTAHGVASGRLEPHGFGSTRPVADNATADGRFLNRRVEISAATEH